MSAVEEAVRDHATLNGIDFLEVLDDPTLPPEARQRTLFVNFLKPLSSLALTKEQVRIEGGERIRDVEVSSIAVGTEPGPTSSSRSIKRGIFRPTLRLIQDPQQPQPPAGLIRCWRRWRFPSRSIAQRMLIVSQCRSVLRHGCWSQTCPT